MATREQPLLELADSILYLASLLRNQPRPIDRYIDYFGGGAPDVGYDSVDPGARSC